jgi:UDPglucose--hexose-1-phosphate uridylyltransferase
MSDIYNNPHRRMNILTGEWVLVSPHRTKRPWQGKLEEIPQENRPVFDENCYLCPGNKRADGSTNDNYTETYSFVNDFSALLPNTPNASYVINNMLFAESQRGICKVLTFSPRHDLTLAKMEVENIVKVIELWQKEFSELSKIDYVRYIQIFENKGEIMGCSNPHPHGQIWATSTIPMEVEKETKQFLSYFQQHNRTLLSDYLSLELEINERIVLENEHFVVLVPYWAVWPYETIIISKRPIQDILQLTTDEKEKLATIMKKMLMKFDALFGVSFPYSSGIHQRPVNDKQLHQEWHFHIHFYPPLLRSATVKKFMVGYELLANPQRDITAEMAAETLRNL